MVPFLDEVKEFNTVFEKPINTVPTIPSEKDAKFILDTIREETQELEEAFKEKNIVEVLDALLDLEYFIMNGALVCGLENKILDGYREVQASNMSKLCFSEEIAKCTVEAMEKKYGVPYYLKECQRDGKKYWVVYRKSDNKVGKSITYFRPDLRKFFSEEELVNSVNHE